MRSVPWQLPSRPGWCWRRPCWRSILIESREPLHRLVRQIAPNEIFTLGKFLILIGVILPLVPRHAIVAWTPITPYQVWLALVATSTLSYFSYLLQTYLPARSSALLPAVLVDCTPRL